VGLKFRFGWCNTPLLLHCKQKPTQRKPHYKQIALTDNKRSENTKKHAPLLRLCY